MVLLKRSLIWALAGLAALAMATGAGADGIASVPGIDAPELAVPGNDRVGFRTLQLVNPAQPDLLAADPIRGAVPLRDRPLTIDLWYPATVTRHARPVRYSASFWGEPPRAPVRFTVAGIAVRDAPMRGRGHPLVIVSHGYSNAPASMSWLTENLATKGYVVAAIHHRDPNPYLVSPAARAVPNYNRPVDIAFVAGQIKQRLGGAIDPGRVALIGYSQGGYGVLTAGGATLDPEGPNAALVPGGWLKHISRGGDAATSIVVPGVRAIVAMAPAGGSPRSAWGEVGLAAITAPLLLIAGSDDPVVDYRQGALTVFGQAVHSNRYLLTYRMAGHAIGLNPVPDEMRGSVWDFDWFEDPVWRQDRINAINLHFITAFLGRHLRGQAGFDSYLDVAVANSNDGIWAAPAATPWGAYSPGGPGVTLWKGFQRRHAQGMELRHAAAVGPGGPGN